MSTIHRVEPEPRPAKRTWQPVSPRRPQWETESTLWSGPPVELVPVTQSESRTRRKLNRRRRAEQGQVTT